MKLQHLDRFEAINRIVQLDKTIINLIAECYENQRNNAFEVCRYISDLLRDAPPLVKCILLEDDPSCVALDRFIGKNIMILARLEQEPDDSCFPGVKHRAALREVLYSTVYTIHDSSGTYITEKLGPSGLTDFDVKSLATTVTAIVVGKRADELPDSYRSRVWRGYVQSQPFRRSRLH